MRRTLAALLLSAAAAGPASASTVCRVADGELTEISGLAAVGAGYVVAQDSGAAQDYLVLDGACATVASVRLEGVEAEDVEDLGVGPDDTLYLADIGDNRGARPHVRLYSVPLSTARGDVTQPDVRTVVLRYPDGPRDAEALLVLPDGRLAVVTKTYGGVAPVYATAAGGAGTLERLGEVEVPQASRTAGPIGAFGSTAITGGAVSPDGRLVALRTYADVLVWPLLPDLVATFATPPLVLTPPEEPQGEAVSFAADSRSVLVVSEGENPPVYAEPLPAALLARAASAGSGAPAPAASASPAGTATPSAGATGEGGPSGDDRRRTASDGVSGSRAALLGIVGGGVLVLLLAAAAAVAGRRR